MSSLLRRHAREIKDGVIRLWWIFVIVIPLCGLVLWLAIDYTNANAARQQRHANVLLERKFRQALSIQVALFSYSTNKSVCGFRKLVTKPLQRARAVVDDPKATPAAKAASRTSIRDLTSFLDTQVTIPSDFDCSTLPKKPPKPESIP